MRWSEKLAALSPADRKRLGDLVEREGSALDLFPLSYTQEWVWWNSRLRPTSPMYHVSVTLRLEGTVRIDVLERTLREIVSRHETLRSGFHALGRTAVQAADAVPDGELLVVTDLRRLGPGEQTREVERLVSAERTRPFTLTDGRMLRALLLRLSDDSSLLALTTHQLVFDDWSLQILVREVETLYAAFGEGRPSPLSPLPVQYADFSLWQRRWMDERRMEEEFAYWEDRLSGIPALLDLPTDLPRPAVREVRGTVHDLVLDAERTEALRALCRRTGVTPYMALTAVLHLWLARATGQDRFATGTLTAYRDRPETANVIGDFSNMIAIPADLGDRRMTFHELLSRTRDTVLETQEHADMPSHRLTGRLRPGREESHNPLTQVTLLSVHAMNALATADLGGLRLRYERVGEAEASSPFDVEVRLIEKPGTFTLQFVVSRGLFDADTVPLLADQYGELLDAALADPGAELASLAVPPVPVPTGPVSGSPAGPVDEAVRRWAAERPERTALETDAGSLGYGELWRRVEAAVERSGGGTEPLTVPADRGEDTVVEILAALRAGRALDASAVGRDGGRAARLVLEPGTLAELLRLWAAGCGVSPGSRCLRMAPPGSALFVVETLLPLYAGATVCQTPGGVGPTAPDLPELLAKSAVDVAVLPSAVLPRLGRSGAKAPGTVVVTGEHGRLPAALAGRAGGTVLRAVGPEGLELWPVPVGRDRGRGPEVLPVAGGLAMWPAGADGTRRQPGAVGELRLAGPAVPGGALATGLLARETATGGIELLGAVAEQRTVAGYRIRPAEIRWVLTGLDDVADAVVEFGADGGLTARLAVAAPDGAAEDRAGSAPNARELLGRARLPGYLRPALVTVVDELPADENGRLERAAPPVRGTRD